MRLLSSRYRHGITLHERIEVPLGGHVRSKVVNDEGTPRSRMLEPNIASARRPRALPCRFTFIAVSFFPSLCLVLRSIAHQLSSPTLLTHPHHHNVVHGHRQAPRRGPSPLHTMRAPFHKLTAVSRSAPCARCFSLCSPWRHRHRRLSQSITFCPYPRTFIAHRIHLHSSWTRRSSPRSPVPVAAVVVVVVALVAAARRLAARARLPPLLLVARARVTLARLPVRPRRALLPPLRPSRPSPSWPTPPRLSSLTSPTT